jgi:superfamily I DNA/RNA helicase
MPPFIPTGQQTLLLETEQSALVTAGPGTGKTRTAIEKARRAIPALRPGLQKVLFLSFSNAAVHRLIDGVNENLSRAERASIAFRTYHAFAADLLRSYGRFVGLPPVIKVMDSLEEMFYRIEEAVPTTGPAYDDFLKRRASDGLLGFGALIPRAVRLLDASSHLCTLVGRAYPLIIVDEFQDTSESQWCLLKAIGQNSQVIAFGDPNQIIFAGMHAATERRLKEFQEWKGVEPVTFSERQFRFGSPEILVFADALLTGTKYVEKEDSGVQLWDLQFRTRDGNRLRSALALLWQEIRKAMTPGETIAFLAFSNSLAEQIAVDLRSPPAGARVGFPVYARLTRDEAAYDSVLLALAALRDYVIRRDDGSCRRAAVALMAMNAAWNSRASVSAEKLTEVVELLRHSLARETELGRCMAGLAGLSSTDEQVRQCVAVLSGVDGFKSSCKRIAAHGKLNLPQLPSPDAGLPLFDQVRAGRNPKGLEGYDAGPGHTHVLNYHRTKGREFDHVVMLVDPRAESSKISLDELRRLYYVCATRAKASLVVLYYGNDKGRVLAPVV